MLLIIFYHTMLFRRGTVSRMAWSRDQLFKLRSKLLPYLRYPIILLIPALRGGWRKIVSRGVLRGWGWIHPGGVDLS